MELHWSATFFKEMVKTKSDLLKNLDNFYKNRFHIETFMSYMNMYHCSTFKPQYSEPWYSEFHDIVNKTQLPFWGFTRHITFDIVNLSIQWTKRVWRTHSLYWGLSVVLIYLYFLHFFGALWLEISWLLRPVNDDSIFRCSWQTYCQYQFTILYVIFSPWKIKIKKPSRLFIVMWLATQGELYWYPAGFLFPLLYSQLFRNLTRRRG